MAEDTTRLVAFKLPVTLLDRLDALVEQMGLGNRSDHLRRALDEYVARYEQTGAIAAKTT